MYSFSGNCKASAPISTFMCLWAQQNRQIDRGNKYKCRSQTHECGNWDCGCASLFLGIYVPIFGIGSLQCSLSLGRFLYKTPPVHVQYLWYWAWYREVWSAVALGKWVCWENESASDVHSCMHCAAAARKTVYHMSGMTWSCRAHQYRRLYPLVLLCYIST
jgi:hypothetical protein